MRRLQVAAEDVIVVHRARHGNFAESDGGAGSDGAVVARKTEIAIGPHDGLLTSVSLSVAGVQTVALHRELLVPERSVSEGVMGLMAINAEIRAGTCNWRFAARTEVVQSDDVTGDLSDQGSGREDNCKPYEDGGEAGSS